MTSKKEDSLHHGLDVEQAKPGCSWGSAFSAAASVKLEEVDAGFLERTQSTATPLAGIAELAKVSKKRSLESKKEKKQAKKAKRARKEEADVDNASPEEEDVSSTPVLEGQMVTNPNKDEQVMVLVDKKKKIVYSSTRKTEDGDMIAIGKLRSSGKIKWQSDAFDNDDNDNEAESFPFPADPDDHCETPMAAYKDILPLMEHLFQQQDQCKIYDPYYCDGAVKHNLESLGFPQVHNVKEDCYQMWSSGNVPELDALITNPPYSEDHIPKLVDFLSSPTMDSKPWFLCMPQFVSKKPYFVEKWDKKAFYIVPRKRYVYLPPKDFREKKDSDVHKKSSPFISQWFIWGGSVEKTNMLYDYCNRNKEANDYEVARSKNGLRDLRRKNSKKARIERKENYKR